MSNSDIEKILEILKDRTNIAFLATVDGDRPDVRAITPRIEDDLTIWLNTSSGSRKVEQIENNPNIALAFIEYSDNPITATVYGKAELVEDRETRRRIWDLAGDEVLRGYFPDGPDSERYCLIKVHTEEIKWWDEDDNEMKIYMP